MERYKSKKQRQRFIKGKTALRDKLRRKGMHVTDPATGKGILIVRQVA